MFMGVLSSHWTYEERKECGTVMLVGAGDEWGARIDSSTFSALQDSIPYRDTRTGKNTNTQLQYSLYWLLLRLV